MRAAYALLLRLEAVLAASFLLLMVALIFTGGVARMMRHPLNWTIDLATCFFAWAAFLCADIAWRNDALISIDVLIARLPRQVQRALVCCNYLIIAAFLLYLIYSGLVLSYVSRARSFQGIPEVSYSWVTMSLPVGGALLLVTTLLKLGEAWRGEAPFRRAGEAA
jgi:TRAP-type C4-dicarboxylate transport system permease small subunit